jgi:hypothetical protein
VVWSTYAHHVLFLFSLSIYLWNASWVYNILKLYPICYLSYSVYMYIYIYIHTKFTHCLINTWMKVSLSYHHVFSRETFCLLHHWQNYSNEGSCTLHAMKWQPWPLARLESLAFKFSTLEMRGRSVIYCLQIYVIFYNTSPNPVKIVLEYFLKRFSKILNMYSL